MLDKYVLALTLLLPAAREGNAPSRKPPGAALDAAALSARIDEHIAARWKQQGVQPAAPADDAEFFRRLSLDLNGRIPSVAQLKDFLDDTRPDKRRLWVDELLGGPDNEALYAEHFARYWRRLLLAHAGSRQSAVLAPRLEDWVRQQIKARTPYDRFVRELLTEPEAAPFYLAHESKPENLAGSTARLFLGIKLDCVQCHDDRSGGSWKQTQFWEFAAFFAGLPKTQGGPAAVYVPAGGAMEDRGPARLQIQDTGKWADARFLQGARLEGDRAARPRRALAEWLTHADNPWFARAAVNRLWHYFLGTGLVEPVDGLGYDDNPASHPELLEELSRQFVLHRFDVTYLIRAITGSRTYQLSSKRTHAGQDDPRRFARAAVRGLSAEQLHASVLAATGYQGSLRREQVKGAAFGATSPQAKFFALFDDPHAPPAHAQTSIQQALFLMNSAFMDEVTDAKKSQVLAVLGGSKRPTAQCIEDLYLVTLSRPPRPEESQRLVRYVEEGPHAGDRPAALRAVLWVLLNSTEFVVNH